LRGCKGRRGRGSDHKLNLKHKLGNHRKMPLSAPKRKQLSYQAPNPRFGETIGGDQGLVRGGGLKG